MYGVFVHLYTFCITICFHCLLLIFKSRTLSFPRTHPHIHTQKIESLLSILYIHRSIVFLPFIKKISVMLSVFYNIIHISTVFLLFIKNILHPVYVLYSHIQWSIVFFLFIKNILHSLCILYSYIRNVSPVNQKYPLCFPYPTIFIYPPHSILVFAVFTVYILTIIVLILPVSCIGVYLMALQPG